eukprot:432166_1
MKLKFFSPSFVSICILLHCIYIPHVTSRELLVSQSQPEPTRASVMGAYGQDCTPPFDDNPPDNCIEAGQSLFAPLGKIECAENFDCCLCGSIKCGFSRNPNTGNIVPCSLFHANGDSGAFGVKSIDIIGSPSSGAVINCGGDQSCNGTAIYGLNIASIQCSGDSACAQSQWDITCLADDPCSLNCRGDHSCSGIPHHDTDTETRDMVSATVHRSTWFIVDNTAGLNCADEACVDGVFLLEQNIGGGSVLCHGENACRGAIITINNIDAIVCGGVHACKNAKIRVIDPQQDFSLECSALEACEGLDLEIFINEWSSTDFFKTFDCGGRSACYEASMTVINYGANYLTIESLECGAAKSCQLAKFDIINGGFEDCVCGSTIQQSCEGTIGIDSCFAGLDKLECVGMNSCEASKQTLTNIANDFELICGSLSSCQSMALTININDHNADPVTVLKGYKCGADHSCAGANIEICNQQQNEEIVIEKIECDGIESCKDTVFGCIGQVVIQEIACGDDGGCDGCVVQIDNQQTVSCDP